MRQFEVADELVLIAPSAEDAIAGAKSDCRAMTLNVSGRAIWRLCDGLHTLEEISEQLAGEFMADKDILRDQVRSFVDRMSSEGFLAPRAKELSADHGASSMYETPPELLEQLKRSGKGVHSLGLGFKKVRLDPQLHGRLRNHLAANIRNFRSEPSNAFLRTENSRSTPSLLYTDLAFNRQILTELQSAHEQWSGRSLKQAACYGVRVYQHGSYLYNHVDIAKTHVVSSTICIDRQLRQPWPLYIEDLSGNPHEVFIEPGEMVFFEGALLMHGRPYPMDGDYYAGMFVHYTPLDWDLGNVS